MIQTETAKMRPASAVAFWAAQIASVCMLLGPVQAQSTSPFTQTVSGAAGSWQQFSIDIPAGTGALDVMLSGSMGDADLYVRFGDEPTAAVFDCRPYLQGSNEACTIPNPQAGTWRIGVNGFTDYSAATLMATWAASKPTAMPPNPTAGQGSPFTQPVSGASGSWQRYTVNIPAGTSLLTVVLSGGTGDADLYVRFGQEPTADAYDCRPYMANTDETCTFANPQAGVWHLGVNGFSAYDGATLTATWTAAAGAPPATPPTTPPQTPPAGDWQTNLLNKHNEYRAQHCAPAMTWDDQVAQTAQAWADMCVFQHDGNSPYGENLASGTAGTFDPVALWYNEIAAYNFAAPGFSAETGHFTQVVWRGTTKLGCGRAVCPNFEYYVCRYEPAGNVAGQFEQNVLPAGAACP